MGLCADGFEQRRPSGEDENKMPFCKVAPVSVHGRVTAVVCIFLYPFREFHCFQIPVTFSFMMGFVSCKYCNILSRSTCILCINHDVYYSLGRYCIKYTAAKVYLLSTRTNTSKFCVLHAY